MSYRVQVYRANEKDYNELNKKSKNTKFGVNKFSDLTRREFARTHLNVRLPVDYVPKAVDPESHQMKSSVHLCNTDYNWLDQGLLTDVRDQGACGSCWAFAALGAMEGALLINNDETTDLSEQELVDCAGGDYGNSGCNGGWMGNAFAYIIDNGISTEDEYPYKAEDQSCEVQSGSYRITDYKEGEDCAGLAAAIALGPVTVAVDASEWGGYQSGVFSECGTEINHGVVLVGAS